jgi:hypothetical protein
MLSVKQDNRLFVSTVEILWKFYVHILSHADISANHARDLSKAIWRREQLAEAVLHIGGMSNAPYPIQMTCAYRNAQVQGG